MVVLIQFQPQYKQKPIPADYNTNKLNKNVYLRYFFMQNQQSDEF